MVSNPFVLNAGTASALAPKLSRKAFAGLALPAFCGGARSPKFAQTTPNPIGVAA